MKKKVLSIIWIMAMTLAIVPVMGARASAAILNNCIQLSKPTIVDDFDVLTSEESTYSAELLYENGDSADGNIIVADQKLYVKFTADEDFWNKFGIDETSFVLRQGADSSKDLSATPVQASESTVRKYSFTVPEGVTGLWQLHFKLSVKPYSISGVNDGQKYLKAVQGLDARTNTEYKKLLTNCYIDEDALAQIVFAFDGNKNVPTEIINKSKTEGYKSAPTGDDEKALSCFNINMSAEVYSSSESQLVLDTVNSNLNPSSSGLTMDFAVSSSDLAWKAYDKRNTTIGSYEASQEGTILTVKGLKYFYDNSELVPIAIRCKPLVCAVGSADGTKYGSVKEALAKTKDNAEAEAAGTPTKIVMLTNDCENIDIPADRNILLDLNGQVIYSGAVGKYADDCDSVIENKGQLTIVDSNKTQVNYFKYYEHSDEYCGAWEYLLDHESAASDVMFENINKSELTSGETVIAVKGGCITGGSGTYISDLNVIYGGGIYNLGTLTINGGNIIGNHSRTSGAIHCASGSKVTMNGGTLAGNTFGAVEVIGTMEMTGGLICNNYTNDFGGGISVYPGGKLTISGSATSKPQISYNTASDGGGIRVCSNSDEVGKLTIIGNAEISYNEAEIGGGIYLEGALNEYEEIENYAVLEMNSNASGKPQITHNRTILDGTGIGQGGGICLNNAKMTCTGGIIKYNSAANSGGGISIDENSICSISDTTITNNNAKHTGGGISVGDESGCFIEGTKITMADGSTKNIEDVKNGDLIRTFDHETGELSTEKVLNKYASDKKSTAMKLHFEDGIVLGIVGSHGLLEKESRKYIALSSANADDYVGKYFYNADSAKWVKLLSVSYTKKTFKYYALYSAHHIDCIANHMLSVTDDALFRLNVFELDKNLKIDQAKKQQDIEKYGLTEYDDYKDVVDEDSFYNLNNQYDHIAVCKGLITREALLELAAQGSDTGIISTLANWEPVKELTASLTASLAGQVMPDAALTIGKNVNISDNTTGDETKVKSNVYLASDKLIEIDGANNTTPISLSMAEPGRFTVNGAKSDTKYFSSEDATYKVAFNNNDTKDDADDDYLELIVPEAKDAFIASGFSSKTINTIEWTEVEGADGYDVFSAKCGKRMKKVQSTTALYYTKTGLKKRYNYKYYVKAFTLAEGKKEYIAATPIIHIAGSKSSRSNAVELSANYDDITLETGTSDVLKAKVSKKSSNKAVLWRGHVSAPIRYLSSDTSVATVDSKGKITATGKGTAYVYAYATNGVYAKVEVTAE